MRFETKQRKVEHEFQLRTMLMLLGGQSPNLSHHLILHTCTMIMRNLMNVKFDSIFYVYIYHAFIYLFVFNCLSYCSMSV